MADLQEYNTAIIARPENATPSTPPTAIMPPNPAEIIDLTQDDESKTAVPNKAFTPCGRCQIKKRKCDGQRPCNLCQLLGTDAEARCEDAHNPSGLKDPMATKHTDPTTITAHGRNKRPASPNNSALCSVKALKTASLSRSSSQPSAASVAASGAVATSQGVALPSIAPLSNAVDTPVDKSAPMPRSLAPSSIPKQASDQDAISLDDGLAQSASGFPVIAAGSSRPNVTTMQTTDRQTRAAPAQALLLTQPTALNQGAHSTAALPRTRHQETPHINKPLPPSFTQPQSQLRSTHSEPTNFNNTLPVQPSTTPADSQTQPPVYRGFVPLTHASHGQQGPAQYPQVPLLSAQHHYAPAPPTFFRAAPTVDQLLTPIRQRLEEKDAQIARREQLINQMDREHIKKQEQDQAIINDLRNQLAAKQHLQDQSAVINDLQGQLASKQQELSEAKEKLQRVRSQHATVVEEDDQGGEQLQQLQKHQKDLHEIEKMVQELSGKGAPVKGN